MGGVMELDPLFLSRFQFAFLIAFHFLLPAFTIGLASYIAVLEALHWRTGRDAYLRLSIFWTRIFALSFGMGVVSGIVMPFQIGTNWSRYAEQTANVIAPLMGYEGLMAFFLEAAFLGILLFGRALVPKWAHFASAVIVAFGTLFSAFWILAANSWMHTPAGFEIVDGNFIPTSWTAVIFNPSFPYRFMHTVVAVYLTTAFTVIGVAAYFLRRGRHVEEAKIMIVMGLLLSAALLPTQAVLGDLHGLNSLEHQPAKIAAMEAIWEGGPEQAAVLFALPDESNERNRMEISIPALASLYLTHDTQGVVPGLKDFPRDERPPVLFVFFGFRVMVAMWLIMLTLTVWGGVLAWRRKLQGSPRFLRLASYSIPAGYIAVTAGWITTETGRQPWVVHGYLRTSDAVTPSITGGDVALSLLLFVVVYALIFGAGVYYLLRIVKQGLPEHLPSRPPAPAQRPARPLSAATNPSDGG
ncbi:MAG TPA: cytochrome ubiquinol oxidase subunit I [Burkholderiales bacterium]|nr:cytochrome ubiquinol oxidase subunit I [Burkholderiales bacterium]